jgi:Binding-protein-dependent transport system inner membrane component
VIPDLTLPKWPAEINRESVETLANLAVQDGLVTEQPDGDAPLPRGWAGGAGRWGRRAARLPRAAGAGATGRPGARPVSAPTSRIAVALAVLLFGTDLRSKLLLVVYASFWQVLIQVLHGVHDVDPVAMDTAHSYGLGRWARTRHVVRPTALPYAVTGSRLAAAVALVLAVTAELPIGSPGLGRRSRSPRPAAPSRPCRPWWW